jgi:hypothetical protein
LSKRGLYIGGHSRVSGSPKAGYVSDHPFGYLTRDDGRRAKREAAEDKRAEREAEFKKKKKRVRAAIAGLPSAYEKAEASRIEAERVRAEIAGKKGGATSRRFRNSIR